MTWVDGFVALGVLAAFCFFMYVKLSEKHPGLQEIMHNTFGQPMYQKIEPDLSGMEVKQQIWNEHRTML